MSDKLKVVFLSRWDCAGSGQQIVNALKQYNVADAVNIVFDSKSNLFGYKIDIMKDDICDGAFYELINNADIIHFKGDDIIKDDKFLGFNIPKDKPKVITVGGSWFRMRSADWLCNALGLAGNTDEKLRLYLDGRYDLVTALTPDLCYTDNIIYTPHAYPVASTAISWKYKEPLIVSHIPTGRDKKGTDKFLIPALEGISEVNLKVVKWAVSNEECLRIKSAAQLYADQFVVGTYGVSAIETMAMGIPTIAYVHPMCKERIEHLVPNCPIIASSKRSVKAIHDSINDAIKTDLRELSNRSRQWVEAMHDYKQVAMRWKDLYNKVLH